jgi:hypothetical protein
MLPMLIATPLVLLAFAAFLILKTFWVSSEVTALRKAAFRASPAQFQKRIEVSAGWAPLALTRLAAGFASLPREASLVLQAARGGEASVCRLNKGSCRPDLGKILASADAAMTRKGWDRVTGVIQGRDLVAVYAPQKTMSPNDVRVCVLALTGHDLVCASVRADLAPLLELIREKAGPSWNFEESLAAESTPSEKFTFANERISNRSKGL